MIKTAKRKWYVFDMDGVWTWINEDPGYHSKAKALKDITCACIDGRVRPICIRIEDGVYQYTPPATSSSGDLMIVREDKIGKHGFKEALEAYSALMNSDEKGV